MRISSEWVTRICAVCDRTLLQGEQTRKLRRAPGGDALDVCALCERSALEHGWAREGTPLLPTVSAERRKPKQKLPSIVAIFLGAGARRQAPEPVQGEPILRRLSDAEHAIVEAADAFNESDFRRTAAGLIRSLGAADVSIVPLSGIHGEVILTIAWELSWYQYRIDPDGPVPVRLAERGYELKDIDPQLTAWNAHLVEDGRVVPEIARL
jgi:hypothetical protein